MSKNARLTVTGRIKFPEDLFEPKDYDGNLRYGCGVLVEKGTPMAKTLNAAVEAVKSAGSLGNVSAERVCVSDGDESEFEADHGHLVLRCGNNKRPKVVNRNLVKLPADNDVLYAGCVVNVDVEIWAQKNKFGKRVNADLLGVQFVREGDRIGGGTQPTSSNFKNLDEDDSGESEIPF